jgi:hypothetical protein
VTKFIANILLKFGIDGKVGSGLCVKILSMIAGPIGSFIVVFNLSTEKQGLFYLFNSILALRILFDLGVGTSVVQITSHLRAKNQDSGEKINLDFVAMVNRWMLNTSLIYCVLAGLGGYLFISSKINDLSGVTGAWVVFVIVSTLQFASQGKWSILEGLDKIQESNSLRIKNSLIQYIVQWSLLFLGLELYSFCLAAVVAYLSQEYYFHTKYSWLNQYKYKNNRELIVDYKNDLVGLLKKASQTYLAGYFVFQIQQPICYHFLGPESLAKLGFTQTIANMMLGIPVVWISMNFPNFSYLIANNRIEEARKEFVTKWRQSLLMTGLAFVFTILILEVLRKFEKFGERILDVDQVIILVTSLTLHAISMGIIYWPRSFKVEPFTRIAYIQMFLTPIAFYTLVKYAGLVGAVWANMLTWIVGFVGISLITRNYWKMQQAHA